MRSLFSNMYLLKNLIILSVYCFINVLIGYELTFERIGLFCLGLAVGDLIILAIISRNRKR